MICLAPRSDQISIALFPTTPAPNHMRVTIPAKGKKVREGCRNVPQPPSPQMVIEILSAIAWPTTRIRGRLVRRSEEELLYRSHTKEGHGLDRGVLGRNEEKYESTQRRGSGGR